MREIKFRAWDNMYHKMIYPNGITQSLDAVKYQDGKHMVTQYHSYLEWMQYTGLKDKNGGEIYEGDICEVLLPHVVHEKERKKIKCVVGYDAPLARFILNEYYNGESDWDIHYFHDDLKLVIIGNIHENRELLDDN